MISQTNVLILSAGFGTRLKPWTDEVPKPLIPVAGVEALYYALFRCSQAGFKKTFVNAHYKADQIEKKLKEFQRDFPELALKLSHEKEILGTGGAIYKLLRDENIKGGLLVLNGDTLSSLDLRPLLKEHSTFSISFDESYFKRYNPVYVDAENNWVGLEKKESLRPAHILGAHYLCESDLQLLKRRAKEFNSVDLFSGIYKILLEEKRTLKAVEFLPIPTLDSFWFDLTSRDFLLEAKSKLSGAYFPLWRDVLAKRHPTLKREDALAYWPLSST